MKIQAFEDNTGFAPTDSIWHAYDDATYDGGALVGYGATEEEAIADLMEKLDAT